MITRIMIKMRAGGRVRDVCGTVGGGLCQIEKHGPLAVAIQSEATVLVKKRGQIPLQERYKYQLRQTSG